MFGQVAAWHTGFQFAAWSEAPAARPMGRLSYYTNGATGSDFQGNDTELAARQLDHERLDAYVDDDSFGVSLQGIRAADANTTQWMTPDWFGGYADDVMSQQPYMWNNNNGLMYSDPSGFGVTVTAGSAPCGDTLNCSDIWDMFTALGGSPLDGTQIGRPHNDRR